MKEVSFAEGRGWKSAYYSRTHIQEEQSLIGNMLGPMNKKDERPHCKGESSRELPNFSSTWVLQRK